MRSSGTYAAALMIALATPACGNSGGEEKQDEPDVPPVAPTATDPSELPERQADRRRLLGVGAAAPDFSMEAHDGQTITLSEIDGPVVLFFYPRDGTPGCTRQNEAFRDMGDELSKLGATVIGVSMDSLESHREFAKDHDLGLPLLSDTDGALAARYGVSTRAGFAERVTFVIDADKKIARVFARMRPRAHVGHALTALKEL